MSRDYALEKGVDIIPVSQNQKYIELASRDHAELCGKVRARFNTTESPRETRGGYVDCITFYILECPGVGFDFLLGEKWLEPMKFYEERSDSSTDLASSTGIPDSKVYYIKW